MQANNNTISDQQRLVWLTEAAQGLRYLEKHGVVHRDVAARNCLLTGDDTCKIGDLGLSAKVGPSGVLEVDKSTRMPVRWMAPEVLKDAAFGHQSDVYAFGLLIVEVFTNGQEPWADMNLLELVNAQRTAEGPPMPVNEAMSPKVLISYVFLASLSCLFCVSLMSLSRLSFQVTTVVHSCLARDPFARPSFLALKLSLRKLAKKA